MFGRKARKSTAEFLKDLKERTQTIQNIDKKDSEVAQKKQKYQSDKKFKASRITIGDQVLVMILAFEGKHKISDKVIDQPRPDIPVFKIRSESDVLNYRFTADESSHQQVKLILFSFELCVFL